MKRVFSTTNECVKAFMKQSQDVGRAGNVSFEGNVFYSYDQAIAKIINNYILIIDWKYSRTTAKHISYITYASSDYDQIYVMNPNGNYVLPNIESIKDRIQNHVSIINSARKPEKYIDEYYWLIRNAEKYKMLLNTWGYFVLQDYLQLLDEVIKIEPDPHVLSYLYRQQQTMEG